MQLHLSATPRNYAHKLKPLFSSSLFASIHNQSPLLRSQMTAKVEHSLNTVLFYRDISLRTTLKLRTNGRNNFASNHVEQRRELLANKVTSVCRGLSDTFMVTNIGFLSCTAKVRPKSAMSTSKRDEQPRHFHMGVSSPSKEQD